MTSLVLTFFKIGLASFGGGWTIVGIIKTDVLGQGWLLPEEFQQLVAIAQITPGPVALNAATLVGFRLYGILGAAMASLSVVMAPVIIGLLVGKLFAKFSKSSRHITEALKTGTIALITMTVWAFAPSAISSPFNLVLAILSFAMATFTNFNPLWLILGSGIAGSIFSMIFG
ncbi:chromate transporter [Spirochaetota bacterium]